MLKEEDLNKIGQPKDLTSVDKITLESLIAYLEEDYCTLMSYVDRIGELNYQLREDREGKYAGRGPEAISKCGYLDALTTIRNGIRNELKYMNEELIKLRDLIKDKEKEKE